MSRPADQDLLRGYRLGVLAGPFDELPALAGGTSLPYLPLIRHQTLILCGDDDPVTPHVNHRVMARLIPSARLHTVNGGGHLVLVDSAPEISPVITAFLRGANERLAAGAGQATVPSVPARP